MTFLSKTVLSLATVVVASVSSQTLAQQPAPLRIGVVGLEHGHVDGFFRQAIKRPDVQILGIAEPSRALFDKYAAKYSLNSNLYFPSVDALISAVHPEAVVLYTSTFAHRGAVEACARKGVHVMMEKPLAVSYQDALAMADAAKTGHIHVLVNYETTWYASNKAAYDMLQKGELGELRKMIFRDGHEGPKEIHVQPEFFNWLTNPKLNGAGALFDFGCYGADIATWLVGGKEPQAVTAVTRHTKPDIYPQVEDEADVIVTYPKAVAILQGSWTWPYAIKDGVVYGTSASVTTILRDKIAVQRHGQTQPEMRDTTPLQSPDDDNLHLLAAVVHGQISEDSNVLSSLKTNLIVTEILDAARRSAESGRTVSLPLK